MEKGVGVRGSAAGMGCVRVRVGSGFSLSFLVLRTTYVFRTFGSGFMCFFSLFLSLCLRCMGVMLPGGGLNGDTHGVRTCNLAFSGRRSSNDKIEKKLFCVILCDFLSNESVLYVQIYYTC